MAVKIRLKKMGRRHRPFFRVCAMDSREPRDGRVIEELGTYDPMVPDTDARAVLKGERVDYWLGVGAQPTPKVATLIKKYGTDGTHLEKQEAALSKLANRRVDAISSATEAAGEAAKKAAADKAKREEEAAAAKVAEEAAAAEAKAAEEAAAAAEGGSDAESAEASAEETSADDVSAAEPSAEENPSEEPSSEEAAPSESDEKTE